MPGRRSTAIASGPAMGSANGLRWAAGMRAEARNAPVPISRCLSPCAPIVGMVAVPTIVNAVGRSLPSLNDTVSPTRLCS